MSTKRWHGDSIDTEGKFAASMDPSPFVRYVFLFYFRTRSLLRFHSSFSPLLTRERIEIKKNFFTFNLFEKKFNLSIYLLFRR